MNSLTCSDKKIVFYPKKSIVWSLSRLDDLGLIKEKICPGETVTEQVSLGHVWTEVHNREVSLDCSEAKGPISTYI